MVRGRSRPAMAVLIGVLAALALWGPTSASAEVEFELKRSFGPDGGSLTPFSSATSVAVDRGEGTVYVLDRVADAIYKFDLEGNPVAFGGSSPDVSGNELSGLSIEDTSGTRQIGVDPISHRIYVPGEAVLQAFEANGEPAEFTASPGPDKSEIPGFQGLRQVTVDANGDIYTAEWGDPTGFGFEVHAPSGAPLVTDPVLFPPFFPSGIAVAASGVLYLIRSFDKLARYAPSQFPVTASTTYSELAEISSKPALAIAIDPTLQRLYAFERYSEGGSPTSRVEVFDEEGKAEGRFGGPEEDGELGNLDVDEAGVAVTVKDEVTRAFVVRNPAGGGPAQVSIFDEKVCECAPTIESLFATKVSGDSATLRAKINPNLSETSYRFEYGLDDCELGGCEEAPPGGASIGHGRKGVVVKQAIAGLAPQTTYHYRVVAENEKGPSESEGRTLTTQGPGLGFELSDARAWEMVSPPQKHGGALIVTSDAAIQASDTGDGFAYASLGSLFEEPAGNRLPEPATVLAERSEGGVWASRDLTPPHSEATKLRSDTEFNLFSPDLSRAEMEPTDGTPLSPEAIGQGPYLWTDGAPPLFSPLLTAANVPPGTEFGPESGQQSNPVRIEAATPDLEHVAIRSDNAALIAGAAKGSVYLWSGGQLEAVSQLPESEGGAIVEGMLGSGQGSVRNAISSDGSRVFWTPTVSYNFAGIGLPALYLRDMEAGKSVRLDVVKSGAGAGAKHPAFNGASADGSVAFFTDTHRLTSNSSLSGRDLYRCEVGPVAGGLGCAGLTDITAPRVGPGESAEVLDQASAISEDGKRIYFVARGRLDDEPNEEGESAVSGEPNLYLWEDGVGTRFIATLSEEDFPVWGGVPGAPGKLGFSFIISAHTSPDGRRLAFTSEAGLTGPENLNDEEEPNTEVYLYDAEAAPGGQLACVSCNPSGASAVGELLAERIPPDPGGRWAGRWVAATLPEASEIQAALGRSLYRPRAVLDNGRVFFNSVDPLVPADSNGSWDVYQWEPVGVGTCAEDTSAASIVRSGAGCVGLLSSGTSAGDAGFLDADPSGDNVFFLTKGRLSVLDKDDELDAYDARVNGIPAVLNPPSECAGEACQPSSPPPNDPTPSSESFNGAETPLVCRKGQRKVKRDGRTVCVKKKKHKKHHKNNKHKAGNKGRAGR